MYLGSVGYFGKEVIAPLQDLKNTFLWYFHWKHLFFVFSLKRKYKKTKNWHPHLNFQNSFPQPPTSLFIGSPYYEILSSEIPVSGYILLECFVKEYCNLMSQKQRIIWCHKICHNLMSEIFHNFMSQKPRNYLPTTTLFFFMTFRKNVFHSQNLGKKRFWNLKWIFSVDL